MKRLKSILVLFCLLSWGCASTASDRKLLEETYDRPIKGTDTAVVKVGLDKNGMPFVENDTVVVKVGQRIVLVGPVKFQIRFPKGSPFAEDRFEAKDAVMNLVVPREIEKAFKKQKADKLVYKYDIIVDDVVLDPRMIILPL